MKTFCQNNKPLVFYLAGLDETSKIDFTDLIKWEGGEISEDEGCFIRFTTPKAVHQVTCPRAIFFDVQFIYECILKKELLDPTPYKLADTLGGDEYILKQFLTPSSFRQNKKKDGRKVNFSDSINPERQVTAVSSSTDLRNQDLKSVPTDLPGLQTERKNRKEKNKKRPCNVQYEERRDLKMNTSTAESMTIANRRAGLEKDRNYELHKFPKPSTGKTFIRDHRIRDELLSPENNRQKKLIGDDTRLQKCHSKNYDTSRKNSHESSKLKASLSKIAEKKSCKSTNPEVEPSQISSEDPAKFRENQKNVSRKITDKSVKLINPFFNATINPVKYRKTIPRRSKSSSEERKQITQKSEISKDIGTNEKNKVEKTDGMRDVKRSNETNEVKNKQIIDDESTNPENVRHMEKTIQNLKRITIDLPRMKNDTSLNSDICSESNDKMDNRSSKIDSEQEKGSRRNKSSEKVTCANTNLEKNDKNKKSSLQDKGSKSRRLRKRKKNPYNDISGLSSSEDGDYDYKPSKNKSTMKGNKWRGNLMKGASEQRLPGAVRLPFTDSEREVMIKFLVKNRLIFRAKGLVVWKMMILKETLTHRTPQSLQNHFIKHILPHIEERRELKEETMKEFLALRK